MVTAAIKTEIKLKFKKVVKMFYFCSCYNWIKQFQHRKSTRTSKKKRIADYCCKLAAVVRVIQHESLTYGVINGTCYPAWKFDIWCDICVVCHSSECTSNVSHAVSNANSVCHRGCSHHCQVEYTRRRQAGAVCCLLSPIRNIYLL